jgi:hypothetical protein
MPAHGPALSRGIGLLWLVAVDVYRTILHSRGRHRLLIRVGPLLLPGIVATLVAAVWSARELRHGPIPGMV